MITPAELKAISEEAVKQAKIKKDQETIEFIDWLTPKLREKAAESRSMFECTYDLIDKEYKGNVDLEDVRIKLNIAGFGCGNVNSNGLLICW